MKSLLTLMILVAAMVAAPAMAEDGNVSDSTLSSLGLGGMELLSDTDGMSVRGMASAGAGTGVSITSFIVFDPDTGGVFHGQASDGSSASATEAATTVVSQGATATNSGFSVFTATISNTVPTPVTTWTANFGAFNGTTGGTYSGQ